MKRPMFFPRLNFTVYRFFTLCLAIFFFNICTSACQVRSNKSALKSINLHFSTDLFTPEKGKATMSDGVEIINYNDLIMVKTPRLKTLTITELDNENNAVNEKTTSDTLYSYFIYRKNEQTGIQYDTIAPIKGNRFSVDSLLKRKTFKGGTYYDKNLDSLIALQTEKDELKTLIAKYAHKDPNIPKAYDSVYIYSSKKLKYVDYSFYELLDQKFDSKVYKIFYVQNQIPKIAPTGVPRPRMTTAFEFQPIEIKDPEKIIGLFERYSKHSGN